MIERIRTTTIKDGAGNPHRYSTTVFGAKKGTPLALRLLRILSGPIAKFLRTVDFSRLAKGDLESVADLDLTGIAEAVSDFPNRVISEGGFDFVCELLESTKRLKIDPTGQEVWQPLNPHTVDAVYAGNAEEMIRAVVWVITENWAPLSQDGTRSWRGILSGLVPSQSLPATDSETSENENMRILAEAER